MVKLRLASWLNANSLPSLDTEKKKKQNRMSFSGFPSLSAKDKSVEAKGYESKSDVSSSFTPVTPVQEHAPSRMVVLAQKISSETDKIEAYMRHHNLPMPSFDIGSPLDFPNLPPEILKSRHEVIFATRELGLLAHGPRESVRWGIWNVSRLPCRASGLARPLLVRNASSFRLRDADNL